MEQTGLKETLNAFETDILTLNPTHEREIVAEALVTLVGALTVGEQWQWMPQAHDFGYLKAQKDGTNTVQPDIELRKLNYIQDSTHPVSPTTVCPSLFSNSHADR